MGGSEPARDALDRRSYEFAGSAPDVDAGARVTPLSETSIDPEATFETYPSGPYTDLAERHGALFG